MIEKIGERKYITTENLHYSNVALHGMGYYLEVPKGFETDLVSIPRYLEWAFAHDSDRFVKPSIFHDYLYSNKSSYKNIKRKEADKIFYELLRKEGVSKIKSVIMYLTVRMVGWLSWKK